MLSSNALWSLRHLVLGAALAVLGGCLKIPGQVGVVTPEVGGTDPGTTGGTVDSGGTGGTTVGGGDGGTTAGGTGTGTGGGTTTLSPAAQLAAKLGRPAHLMVGLGTWAEDTDISQQGIPIDIFDRYCVGLPGYGGWPEWNPGGTWVDINAAKADALGAVPMFTLYQMATLGDSNLSGLSDSAFMTTYWGAVKLLFSRLAVYDKPALVHLEPDFWGYAQQQAPNGDPTRLYAHVKLLSECSDLPDDITGMGHCLVRLARLYAPKTLVGFPPSTFGASTIAAVIAFMNKVGTPDADFVVMQTLDRDAGCFEAQGYECTRQGTGWYWDETNTTHPSFHDHLALAQQFHDGLQKPLIWWQTPLGVPSTTAGGTSSHYRDNRVHYFFNHPAELVAVGGAGMVFSAGTKSQTNITTDGGQFRNAAVSYAASPAPM